MNQPRPVDERHFWALAALIMLGHSWTMAFHGQGGVAGVILAIVIMLLITKVLRNPR